MNSRRFTSIALLLLLSNFILANEDPFEEYNRKVWAFNEFLDDNFAKPTADSKYVMQSNARIAGWRQDLNKPGLTTKERNAIKNRISALESRLKKRTEHNELNKQVDRGQNKLEDIYNIIDGAISRSNCAPELRE